MHKHDICESYQTVLVALRDGRRRKDAVGERAGGVYWHMYTCSDR